MEKAIVYLRVSSKEQGQEGFSLDAQEKLAMEYAQKHNLEVVKVWKGVESAWGKKDRDNFTELLTYAKSHKDVKHIIFDVLDRMTRNDTDKVRIIRLMREQDKVIHFSRSNRIYSKNLNPDDEFVLDMEVAVAKKMSNDISRKTKMGMIEKAEQGIFPSCAPIGYKNNKIDCSIVVDPVTAPLIKSLFEKAALGYSLEQLADMMFVEGLRGKDGNRIRPNFAHKILHSTFYYGVFQWADNSYNGTHTPLITKELWDKVQKKLAESAQHCHSKHNHAFKGLLRCEDCGCLFIGTVATNRYNSKYSYYRCSHGKGRHHGRGYLTENQIEKELENFVNNISLPDDIIKVIIKGLKHRGMKAARITSTRKENLAAEKKEISTKLGRMLDMQLEGRVANEEIFNLKQKELTSRLANINQELSTCVENPEDTVKRAVNTLEMTSRLELHYKKANNHERAQLMKLLTESLKVNSKNHITPQYREPFKTLAETKNQLNLAKNIPPGAHASDGKSCIINQKGG